MSQNLFSIDPSPFPFSPYRSPYSLQYDENDTKAGLDVFSESNHQENLSNFHLNNVFNLHPRFQPHIGVIPKEKLLHSYHSANSDTSESFTSRILRFFGNFSFRNRVLESHVYITSHRFLVIKELVTGVWRKRVEQQEFIQNLKSIELISENYPCWWFSFAPPALKVFLIIFGMWFPFAWDSITLILSLILCIFVPNLSFAGVFTPLIILLAFSLISRIIQAVVVSIFLYLTTKKSNPPNTNTNQSNINGRDVSTGTPQVQSNDSPPPAIPTSTTSNQDVKLMQTPILYIICLVISFLLNLLSFILSFVAFGSPLASCIIIAIITSFTMFFYFLSLATVPKIVKRFPTMLKLYFSNVSNSLTPISRLYKTEEYNQKLIVFTIIGFLIGWIPGALIGGFLFILLTRYPEDVGYFKENNERVLTFYLNFQDAQQLKDTLWKLKSLDVPYYGDTYAD